VPWQWTLARICEEFGVPLVPGGAVDQPLRTAIEIMRLRGYKAGLALVEDPQYPEEKIPTAVTDLVGRVKAVVEYQNLLREEDAGDAA